jgi:hypothetical protein
MKQKGWKLLECVGEVIVVDEVSLIKVGPARVKIRAKNISKVKGFLEILIEGTGDHIKFIPELSKKKHPDTEPQSQNKNQEGGGGYKDEDEMTMTCMILMMTQPKRYKSMQRRQALVLSRGQGQSGDKHKPKQVGEEGGYEGEQNMRLEEEKQECPISIFNPSTRVLLRMTNEISHDMDMGDGIVTTQEDIGRGQQWVD